MIIREVTFGDLKDDIADLEKENRQLRETLAKATQDIGLLQARIALRKSLNVNKGQKDE